MGVELKPEQQADLDRIAELTARRPEEILSELLRSERSAAEETESLRSQVIESLQDIEAGRYRPAEEVIADLKARLDDRR
ncbi:MAG: hypothetical protein NXI16_15800 [Alphaproteobacteria bacterium]|nr:hypothetical protein [Alphaproteobacteria bacterium]